MPMPHWWAQINKRLFNPRAVNSGKWDVINHVGRTSGETHRTPLDAAEVDGTFIFIVVYGSKSDWVQNILLSGWATLETAEEVVDLVEPRLIPGETARTMIGDQVTLPPRILNVNEYLQMDIAARRGAAHSSVARSQL